MLFGGHVYDYLNPVQCSRRGVDRLRFGQCGLGTLGALACSKMVNEALSGEKIEERKRRVSYTSEDPEVKPTRARCIRVAAIVNKM